MSSLHFLCPCMERSVQDTNVQAAGVPALIINVTVHGALYATTYSTSLNPPLWTKYLMTLQLITVKCSPSKHYPYHWITFLIIYCCRSTKFSLFRRSIKQSVWSHTYYLFYAKCQLHTMNRYISMANSTSAKMWHHVSTNLTILCFYYFHSGSLQSSVKPFNWKRCETYKNNF